MKIKIWPADAKGFMEKFVYVMGFVFATALYLFMQLSAFGVFHNFYSVACKVAGWGWKIPGLMVTGALVYIIYQTANDDDKVYVTSGLALGVIAALSLLFYCGFAYSYIF